jgi:antitoxin component HigA of HigAB toxin-antitoxin module
MAQSRGYPPVLVPSLRDDRDYARALDELEELFLSEAGTPEGRRFDELVRLIEDYEARERFALLGARAQGDAQTGTY